MAKPGPSRASGRGDAAQARRPRGRGDRDGARDARLSIGALSRATGIPVETLRTWEQRYGFPLPERKPSRHRVYPLESVPRLRRIAQALSLGHRAGQVVAASDADLAALIGSTEAASIASTLAPLRATTVEALLGRVAELDGAELTRLLLGEWARLGPLPFISLCVAPLVREVGVAWADKRLDVRHEHFLSERVGDLLRSLRLPLEDRARGGLVVLATLPGERHGLGLQMAALALSATGCRVLYLGTECPPPDLVTVMRDTHAPALGLSVSRHTQGVSTAAQIRRLRERVPRRAVILVGGEGAPAAGAGIDIVSDLEDLAAWARRTGLSRNA